MFTVAVLPRTAGGGAREGGHLGAVSEYECGGGHFVEAVGPAGGVWGEVRGEGREGCVRRAGEGRVCKEVVDERKGNVCSFTFFEPIL